MSKKDDTLSVADRKKGLEVLIAGARKQWRK